jgi:hypothetical protein
LTIFAQIAFYAIFIDNVIHAKIESAASTVFRQAHNIGMTDHVNKKQLGGAKSIIHTLSKKQT